MRSPLAILIIGFVLIPKANGKLVPYYIYRAPPTSSPTSSPSYQPSARPSLQPSSQPSSAPTTSMPPSSLRRNFLTTGATPTSIGFWLTLSLIGILICFVCVGSKRSRKSPCLPCICGDENPEDKVDEDGDGWSAWLTIWSSDKPSKPPAKKKTFLSFFKRSDAEVSPTASSRGRKSDKKATPSSRGRKSDKKATPSSRGRKSDKKATPSSRGRKSNKKPKRSDEYSIGQASSFGSFWSLGQTSNPPPPVKKKKKKTFSSVLKRPDAQVSPTTARPEDKRTSRRAAGGKDKVKRHHQRDERGEDKKTFPSLFGRSDVPRIVASSSRKKHKKPERRVEGGKGRVKEHRHRDKRNDDRKVYAARSPRHSRKHHLNDKYDVESASSMDLDLGRSKRTKRRDDQNKKNAFKPKGSQAGRVVQQRSEESENPRKETWGQALAGLVAVGDPKREVQEDASASKLSQDVSHQQRNLQTKELESDSDVKGKLPHVLPKFNIFGWGKDAEENANDHSGSVGDNNTNGSPWPWQNSSDHDSSNQDRSLDDVSSYDEDHDSDGNSSHSSSCSGSYNSFPRHWGDNESEESASCESSLASCESSLESCSSSESSNSYCSI